MKKNKYTILVALLLCGNLAGAQNIEDALRFSQNIYEGTARFQAMGGAFAAVGGDFSSLSINPAGIGVYRNYEYMVSPSVMHSSTNTNYFGSTTDESRGRFGFGNMGFVATLNTGRNNGGLVSFNYGIGYNKLNNLAGRISAQTSALGRSQITTFAENANGIKEQDLGGNYHSTIDLAYETYLIDLVPGATDEYVGATENMDESVSPIIIYPAGKLDHYYYRNTVGNVGEYVFTVGGNMSNKFYFGMTLGLQSVYYSQYEMYSERAVNTNDFDSYFRSFEHRTNIDASGAGMNFKFGAIYRPTAGLRLGAYIHTPTWMWLTDLSSSVMTSDVFNDSYKDETPVNEYDYRINTPFKWGLGVAYTIGKMALVSMDYEGVDYPSTSMYGRHGRRDDFSEDNKIMSQDFSHTSNIRIGAEVRLSELSLRGGYSFYGSPNKAWLYEQHIISTGIGYSNASGFFMDAAYSFNPSYKYDYYLYESMHEENGTTPPIITSDSFVGKIILTIGFRF